MRHDDGRSEGRERNPTGVLHQQDCQEDEAEADEVAEQYRTHHQPNADAGGHGDGAGGECEVDEHDGDAVGAAVRTVQAPDETALALPQAAILARVTRSAVLENLQKDYIRTARAKGLTRTQALWRHAVRNALIPVVTIMGLQFSFLLAGTIIIEQVFYLPGLGRLIFQAIAQRDLIVVRDLIMLLAATVVIVNFFVDLLYAVLDPRLRSGHMSY